MSSHPVVCVIGAGCSGIVAAKALRDAGIAYTHYEMSDRVGGNWAIGNPNGLSSAYDTLHINTSRERMEFADFAMPKSFPTFPHHSHINRYFNDYVDQFGLRDAITFNTAVQRCERADDGTWLVTTDGGDTTRFDALIVANGHHWDPRWPDPDYPGEFAGTKMHAHDYVETAQVRDKRVVIIGMGNSAMDIATVASYVGTSSVVAARTPTHVLPKWIFGRPFDQLATMPRGPLPYRATQAVLHGLLRLTRGSMSQYNLPEPTQGVLESHPTVSSDFLTRAGHGAIDVRPNVTGFDGDLVQFEDGTAVAADLVIYATGYNITFPFFDPDFLAAPDNDIRLFRNVVRPDLPNLYFIGLAQPLGAIMPIAERQAKWVAGVLAGDIHLPEEAAMRAHIERTSAAMHKRYNRRTRHTIQVDYDDYMLELKLEMWRGRRRARKAGGASQVPALVGAAG